MKNYSCLSSFHGRNSGTINKLQEYRALSLSLLWKISEQKDNRKTNFPLYISTCHSSNQKNRSTTPISITPTPTIAPEALTPCHLSDEELENSLADSCQSGSSSGCPLSYSSSSPRHRSLSPADIYNNNFSHKYLERSSSVDEQERKLHLNDEIYLTKRSTLKHKASVPIFRI